MDIANPEAQSVCAKNSPLSVDMSAFKTRQTLMAAKEKQLYAPEAR
jgi:hypothetical protein